MLLYPWQYFSSLLILPPPFWGRSLFYFLGAWLLCRILIDTLTTSEEMTRLDNLIGSTSPQFDKVLKVFKKNFHDGWEREGASVAVYHKGQLVVDLQGGYADRSAGRLWTESTRTVVFSATKAVGALCVSILVDRGHCNYEDKMTVYWPEFGQNGKENVTIRMLMNHQAGLAALDEPISKEDAKNFEKMAEILAKQKPNWEPGSKHGYHALTYGWIVDQIVRRVDPKHRSVGTFFKEEVADKFGIDFHIGLPPAEEHTVSRLSLPPTTHRLKEVLHDPRVLIVLAVLHLRSPTSIGRKVRENPQWFKLEQDVNTFNDPELHAMEQVAALGITKARDLAKLFNHFMKGEIISKKMIEHLKQPEIASGFDEVVLTPLPKGLGFMYERYPLGGNRWLVGHAGLGGSTIMMDIEEEVVIAYVSNGLKTGMGELTGTYRHLRDAVFECIHKENVIAA